MNEEAILTPFMRKTISDNVQELIRIVDYVIPIEGLPALLNLSTNYLTGYAVAVVSYGAWTKRVLKIEELRDFFNRRFHVENITHDKKTATITLDLSRPFKY